MFTKALIRNTAIAVVVAAGVVGAVVFAVSRGDTEPAQASDKPSAEESAIPAPVVEWADAWNNGDPEQLGALYTDDATYTDHAFDASFTGAGGVVEWATITASSIENLNVELVSATTDGQEIEVQWIFSGSIAGAPESFSVDARTVHAIDGDLIAQTDDYYSLPDVLEQSGLPADIDLTS
ncbi:nuclear transport factor 2 family protein [Ilumatobacter sp.]|uniref:nuclear transport factor 2 family protein n=1 Tax=Ilumatobacter sp. TaxID=1967498 RepID=UPI003B519D86